MTWTAHNDAYSRAVFIRFRDALGPLMAEMAPDWLLHHIEMIRDHDSRDLSERLIIRLIIKPIGEARDVNPDADLLTGPKRLIAKAEGEKNDPR